MTIPEPVVELDAVIVLVTARRLEFTKMMLLPLLVFATIVLAHLTIESSIRIPAELTEPVTVIVPPHARNEPL